MVIAQTRFGNVHVAFFIAVPQYFPVGCLLAMIFTSTASVELLMNVRGLYHHSKYRITLAFSYIGNFVYAGGRYSIYDKGFSFIEKSVHISHVLCTVKLRAYVFWMSRQPSLKHKIFSCIFIIRISNRKAKQRLDFMISDFTW